MIFLHNPAIPTVPTLPVGSFYLNWTATVGTFLRGMFCNRDLLFSKSGDDALSRKIGSTAQDAVISSLSLTLFLSSYYPSASLFSMTKILFHIDTVHAAMLF